MKYHELPAEIRALDDIPVHVGPPRWVTRTFLAWLLFVVLLTIAVRMPPWVPLLHAFAGLGIAAYTAWDSRRVQRFLRGES